MSVTADADLREMIRDPRYRENWHPGSAAYRASVTRAWEERYPGAVQTDETGKQVQVRGYQRTVEVYGKPVTQNVRDYVQMRRGGESQRNPTDVDSFFDRAHEPLQALATRLGLPPEYIMGLSSYESGWLNPHNTALNNPFGMTRGGGNNLRFDSIDSAVRYWETLYGEQVRSATSPEDFADRLLGIRNGRQVPGWRVYNVRNTAWRSNVLASIRTVQRRLPLWQANR